MKWNQPGNVCYQTSKKPPVGTGDGVSHTLPSTEKALTRGGRPEAGIIPALFPGKTPPSSWAGLSSHQASPLCCFTRVILKPRPRRTQRLWTASTQVPGDLLLCRSPGNCRRLRKGQLLRAREGKLLSQNQEYDVPAPVCVCV